MASDIKWANVGAGSISGILFGIALFLRFGKKVDVHPSFFIVLISIIASSFGTFTVSDDQDWIRWAVFAFMIPISLAGLAIGTDIANARNNVFWVVSIAISVSTIASLVAAGVVGAKEEESSSSDLGKLIGYIVAAIGSAGILGLVASWGFKKYDFVKNIVGGLSSMVKFIPVFYILLGFFMDAFSTHANQSLVSGSMVVIFYIGGILKTLISWIVSNVRPLTKVSNKSFMNIFDPDTCAIPPFPQYANPDLFSYSDATAMSTYSTLITFFTASSIMSLWEDESSSIDLTGKTIYSGLIGGISTLAMIGRVSLGCNTRLEIGGGIGAGLFWSGIFYIVKQFILSRMNPSMSQGLLKGGSTWSPDSAAPLKCGDTSDVSNKEMVCEVYKHGEKIGTL